MKYIKGPDFPTGGIVVNKDDLVSIYESGTGKIKLRGKVDVEEMKGGKRTSCHFRDSIYDDRSRNRKILKRCLQSCRDKEDIVIL